MKRRRVVAALVSVLIALLLVMFWQLGGPRRARASASGKDGAAAPLPTAKKTPARDFKRRSGYKVTPFAEGEKFDETCPPHALDAEIEARETREKPGRETKTDINYTDTPLAEVFADLERRYGIRILVDASLDLDGKTVTFKVNQLAFNQTIDLICRMAALRLALLANGDYLILPEDADPKTFEAATSDELRRMEQAIADTNAESRQAVRDRADDAFWTSVKGKTLKEPTSSGMLWEGLEALTERMQVNVVLSAEARREGLGGDLTSEISAGRSMTEVLDSLTLDGKIGWRVNNGVLYFDVPEPTNAAIMSGQSRRAERKAKDDAFSSLMARQVTIAGDNLAIRQVATMLGSALGVPVYIDPTTWHRAARISLDETARPASDIVRILQAAAPLRVTYRDGTLWFLAPAKESDVVVR